MSQGYISEHPLVVAPLSCIRNWQEWKELWKKTILAEFRHSLLHFGFGVSLDRPVFKPHDEKLWQEAEDFVQGQEQDRVCFYLDLADGHNSTFGFTAPNEGHIHRQVAFGDDIVYAGQIRQILSEKAFQVLCLNVFKDRNGPGRMASWSKYVTDPVILKKILWFFRPEQSNLGNWTNIHGETARTFILDVCRFAFQFSYNRDYSTERNEKMTEVLRSLRPQVIEVLWGLGKLDLLFKKYWQDKLDLNCLLTLKELAMKFEIPLEEWDLATTRHPETLEEAVAADSQAARVLHTLMCIGKERKRQKKLEAEV